MTVDAFHWHGESFDLPPGAIRLCESAGCPRQAFSFRDHVLALQFHLETTPGSAAELVAHCDDHRQPGRFVQPADAIPGDPARFHAANRIMEQLLERLVPA
jgi:GMP synthase-like glutamine amidotransferase